MSAAAATPLTRTERWRIAGVVAGASLLLAMFDTSRNFLANALLGRPSSWFQSFGGNLASWVIVALLSPLPIALARRVPIDRARLGSSLWIHALAALVFAVLHTLGMALYIGFMNGNLGAFIAIISKASGTLAIDMMVYASIVGALHAWRFAQVARARELAAAQLQASLTEARLTALRGQLNPHFLFNTLNAISTMALQQQHEHVVRTLGRLGELLRASLDDRMPQEVPLSEELNLLEPYLDIQRIRFGDRLRIDCVTEADTLDALVPSMLLQPFVENAVTHGIAQMPGPGTVRIRTERRGDALVIEVSDTGPGLSTTVVTNTKSSGASGGIGLSNTRARLTQLYGEAHTLELTSAASSGALVRVTMPFRRAPQSTAERVNW